MKVSAHIDEKPLYGSNNFRAWVGCLVTCVSCLIGSPALADGTSASTSTLPFQSGGVIIIKINQGEVEVVGTAAEQVRVAWEGRNRDEERKAKVRLQRAGDKEASLLIDNWDDHVRIRIEVPRQSDVAIHMRAGELKARGIVGSMDVDLLAGEIVLDVLEPERYRSLTASVTAGEIDARPWRAEKSGLWRSLKVTSDDGYYDLRARLLAGQITLRSNESDRGAAGERR